MARPLLSGWGVVFLSALGVTAVAVLLQVQKPTWTASSQDSGSETFCYEGMQTLSEEGEPTANCFTVSDGVFTGTFTSSAAASPSGSGPGRGHDVRAGHVIPGLWDGHGHVMQYGEFLHSVDLFGSDSPAEVRRRIGEFLDAHPGAGARDDWIRGVGWDQMELGTMPTAV